MRFLISGLCLFFAVTGFCQNCGPKYNNQVCAANACCSQYGWCDVSSAHCDPSTCLRDWSGPDSSCAKKPSTVTTSSTAKTTTTTTFATTVPNIDVCGHAQGGVTCPGAGLNGYFYRCCSSAGHCGPKNDIQDASSYCGDGCQAGYGKCGVAGVAKPAKPSGVAGVAGEGENCGPIVNKKCAAGLCCSGSNYCGTGTDFCGSANWCQPEWGACAGKRTI
ncbi:hypothetical protein B0J12DRAFT_65337 [Macrophomina phaseolina]|uniref:Chitin-binding type-1 domain-containing protein n=1 Tax=Macrophomina phaseolina TaxID=35725 RepID=A0ABQ8GCV2_9PEZI|nr:hypothetical protein B0J12DRAFT_65337 [Macrophomina phaseolina]